MNADEIVCLGVDGKIYHIKRFCEIKCDEEGIPYEYEKLRLPQVYLIARGFSVRELEEHPLRKAYFKLWAAKAHNIVEKQRPQDVTIDEAKQMAKDWFLSQDWAESQANIWIREYWN